MHKDELIQMHTLLAQIKNHFEQQGAIQEANGHGDQAFPKYDDLGISPLHVHRSKTDHKKAIFILSQELAEHISRGEYSEPARVGNRLGEILSRMEPAASKAH